MTPNLRSSGSFLNNINKSSYFHDGLPDSLSSFYYNEVFTLQVAKMDPLKNTKLFDAKSTAYKELVRVILIMFGTSALIGIIWSYCIRKARKSGTIVPEKGESDNVGLVGDSFENP